MCGRIGLPELTWAQFLQWQEGTLDWDDITRDPEAPDLQPSWNVKPTQQIEIAYANGSNLWSTTARWWFVPHWFHGEVSDWKQTTFNARIETAFEKPTFRTAWAKGRCVIVASGYFEWTGPKGTKQPWWISAQTNAPVMYMAGLYAHHSSGQTSATILTRAALQQISHIHSRTPVMLSFDQIWPWVSHDIPTKSAIADLGCDWDGRVSYHQVAPFGRDDDGPALIEPCEPRLI